MILIGTLYPLPPYDFRKTLNAVNYHTVLDVVRDGEYWRAVRIDERLALVRVTGHGTVEQPALRVYLVAAEAQPTPQALLQKVGHLLGITADQRPFYALARSDAALWNIVAPLYGLRHVRAETLFEALMTTIVEQQISLRQAQKGERWLVQWAGSGLDYNGETFYTFPRPAQLAAVTLETLTPLKITFRRMQVMMDIARQETEGTLNLDALQNCPPEQVYTALTGIKGIGGWTAGWAVIRALGHYQYIGENDVALQAAINHYFYGQPGKTTPQIVRETLGRYGAFNGAAAFYTLMRWATDRY